MKWINPQRRDSLMMKVLRLLRINRGFEEPLSDQEGIVHVNIPINKFNQDLKLSKTVNPSAYIISKQRMHEIETQKAMIILQSRHNSWKAGGPN